MELLQKYRILCIVTLAFGGGATRPLGVRETRAARELALGAALARDVGNALLEAAARAGGCA